LIPSPEAFTPPNGVASVRKPGTSSTFTVPQRSSRMQRVTAVRLRAGHFRSAWLRREQ
jgi:hypothetical protein